MIIRKLCKIMGMKVYFTRVFTIVYLLLYFRTLKYWSCWCAENRSASPSIICLDSFTMCLTFLLFDGVVYIWLPLLGASGYWRVIGWFSTMLFECNSYLPSYTLHHSICAICVLNFVEYSLVYHKVKVVHIRPYSTLAALK